MHRGSRRFMSGRYWISRRSKLTAQATAERSAGRASHLRVQAPEGKRLRALFHRYAHARTYSRSIPAFPRVTRHRLDVSTGASGFVTNGTVRNSVVQAAPSTVHFM